MRSLHRAALKRGGGGGAKLPTVYPALEAHKVHFRRGELALVAAEPGGGKSSFALNLAMKAGVPTLYVSADSDIHTQMVRMLASLTGLPQDHIESVLPGSREWAADLLRPYSNIRWCFDSAPTLGDLEEEIDAFITLWGRAPELLILDNASDVVADDGDEWASLRALMKDCKFWARDLDMCVVALHHTSESESKKGEPCQPRSAIQGKISQIPALVLTLASSPEGWMWVAPVKNRHGKADKTGKTTASWQFFADTMTFMDNPLDRVPSLAG